MAKKPQIKSLVNNQQDRIQYIVYDLSIPDINERREKAVIYPSGWKLGIDLGIRQSNIPYYTDPLKQRRTFSKQKNGYFAIRVYKP